LYYASERIKNTAYGVKIREGDEALLTHLEQKLQNGREKVLKLFLMELGACAFQLDPDQAKVFFKF